MAMDSVQHQELQEATPEETIEKCRQIQATELKSSLTEEDIDQIVHRNLPKAEKVTIRTYDPDGRKLGSCEKIVEAALGLQEPGSERPSLASEESDPGVPEEGRSLGSLARRALEEAPWIPDEEEKVILVRAIKRLRQRLAIESLSSQQKQLERLEKAEVSPADNAVSQAHNSLEAKSEAPPLHARCSNPMIVAEYQIAKGEELETPPAHTQRRRGILRTSSSLPATGTNVPDLTQLPMNSTTAAAAFRGFSFPKEGESPDSKTSSSPASPRSPRNPLRLPGNLKPRMSMVSIADEEELVEIDEGSRTPPTPRKSTSLSESSTTALETARSSVARSSVFLKSPRHSLANMFRWKRSEVSMGERQRSDLELGHLLGHLLLDAQRRGSIPELLRKEAPAAPAEPDFCLDADPLLSPRPEKLESEKRTPADEGQELQEGTSQPTTPVTPATEAMATTASEEEEQRCTEWMDGYLQTAREENEAQMSRLQESLRESLRKFDEKMDAFTQRFSDLEEEVLHSKEKREPEETDGLKEAVQKQQNALKSNVRSLQIQMEGLEQAQGELLQQLRKAGANRSWGQVQRAESRFVESLEKQVAVHQAQELGSPSRPEAVAKLEEAFGKLLEQHDQQLGEAFLPPGDGEGWITGWKPNWGRRTADKSSTLAAGRCALKELLRQNCMSTEDLGITVSSLSELHERISIGFEGTKEELLEQMRVLRDGNDAKFAAVQELSDVFLDASSQQERIFHQLQSSLKELDKKLFGSAVLLVGEEEASELQKLQDQLKEDQSRLAAELNVLRESNDGKFAALQDATSQQERICNQLQSNLTKKLVGAEEARASELQKLQDQQKEDQSRLADQLNEWTGKFDQLDIRFHNFEDAMETRRAAQQREVDRLFTELQRSFDKLEGTQKTMLADTLPEVASALVQPIQRDVGNLKEKLEGFQSTIYEHADLGSFPGARGGFAALWRHPSPRIGGFCFWQNRTAMDGIAKHSNQPMSRLLSPFSRLDKEIQNLSRINRRTSRLPQLILISLG
ncbi:unnamed protein product [Cladocopium goreaui]|uniref:Uncharacterized protein n=1 Tax=Cladocopium goreaui TaxID=2562237 RepID=A0A9P1G0Q9_9DINO|nr:unnamed protein product [Cladocopium goreaui]